jgi:chromosome segregation ATPase
MTEKGQLDLPLLLEQHQKDIWQYKMKESEWEKTKNQLEGHKKIVVELSTNILTLKKDIDRLQEENDNIRTIENSHQQMNGNLQKENEELKLDNKRLADQVTNRIEQLRKAGM